MFYLSIENSPKLTTKIGVTTITGDRAKLNKYIYLCLKEFLIPLKKKKNNEVILNSGNQKNTIPSKPRKKKILNFS